MAIEQSDSLSRPCRLPRGTLVEFYLERLLKNQSKYRFLSAYQNHAFPTKWENPCSIMANNLARFLSEQNQTIVFFDISEKKNSWHEDFVAGTAKWYLGRNCKSSCSVSIEKTSFRQERFWAFGEISRMLSVKRILDLRKSSLWSRSGALKGNR